MGRKILLLALVIFAGSANVLGDEDEGLKEEMEYYKMAVDFVDECGSKELSLCLKERTLRYINALPNELDFGGGIKIKPNGRFSRKTAAEQLPDEPRAREDAVTTILWDRIADYLSSHTIELKVPPDAIQEMQRSVEEGRGKGGGGGGKKGGGGDRMKGLMMLIQLKAAVLGAIALKFIALVAFKALLVAKIALTISSIIALKKLLEQKHHTSTYEVVAHPHHDDYGHFDRSFTQEQLAYKGYEGAARKDTFKQCLVSYQPHSDLRRCFGTGAISRLQSLDSSPEFDLTDGITLSKDMSQEYREETYNYAERDPSDFRSIVDTFDHVFSKRAMRWDMSFIYPGLAMRVAPSVSPGGILEFVVDPSQEAVNAHRVKEIGTGRLLARQFLLPFLLGFKFNIATLLPIVFGILVILAKKIVFVSKVALILSSAFGLGSLLFNYGGNGQYGSHHSSEHGYYGASQYHPTTFGNHYKGYTEEYLPSELLQYRGVNHPGMDELKLYGSLPDAFGDRSREEKSEKKGRNFAWSEDEKLKKDNPP